MEEKQIFYDYIKSFYGLPYKWSGDDTIKGFDCSGLICHLLQSIGLLKLNEDLTAHDLADRFYNNRSEVIKFGSLCFYGKDINNVTHVGMALNTDVMIEAGGGSSKTLTVEDASKQNAFIKLSPIHRRKDFLLSCYPEYSWTD